MNFDLSISRKNRSMTALIFLKESSKEEAPLPTKVFYSSWVSKRKKALTSRVTIVGALLGKMGSSSIPVRVLLVPTIGGTSS